MSGLTLVGGSGDDARRCPRDGKLLHGDVLNTERLECLHCGYTEPHSTRPADLISRTEVRGLIGQVRALEVSGAGLPTRRWLDLPDLGRWVA